MIIKNLSLLRFNFPYRTYEFTYDKQLKQKLEIGKRYFVSSDTSLDISYAKLTKIKFNKCLFDLDIENYTIEILIGTYGLNRDDLTDIENFIAPIYDFQKDIAFCIYKNSIKKEEQKPLYRSYMEYFRQDYYNYSPYVPPIETYSNENGMTFVTYR